jgi:hypothetical protein
MPAFKSPRDYIRFAEHVTRSKRYIRDKEADHFLEALLREAQRRVETIPAGSILWRAQIGYDLEPIIEGGQHIDDVPCPLSEQRMIPLRRHGREGRANPKGIPYLYLSTERDTAMAEVRPWRGSTISVAQFQTQRELRIVNCTQDDRPQRFRLAFLDGMWKVKDLPSEEWDNAVWSDIDDAFFRPVMGSDDYAEYVPTQIIAELFKTGGFDGAAYRSSVGQGHNVVLFDIDLAVLVNCSLFQVKALSFSFEQCANPYFVKRDSG